jgi:hypothetical protein
VAGGLNKEFIAGPVQFMASNFIYAPDNGLVNGVGQLGLTSVSTRPTKSCRIGPFASTTPEASSKWHGFGSHPISAYYLLGHPQQDNANVLPTTVRFMLTMHLSGCQFLAYGPDRFNVTVEHNNYIGGIGGDYVAHHAQIQGANHPYFFALRPGIDYDPMLLANVVGIRDANGWHFYVRTRAFTQPGPVTGPH